MYSNQRREDIIDYIRTKLGYPVVTLEINLVNPTPFVEVIFTGNGTTTHVSARTSDFPLKSGSVMISTTLNNNGVDVEARLSDSNGNFVGTGGTGTVNYNTGVVEIDFAYPVKAGVQVYISYMIDKKDWIYLQAIKSALQWYSARRGIRKIRILPVTAGQDEYEIDTEPVMRISAVRFGDVSPVFIWEQFNIPLLFPSESLPAYYEWVNYYSIMHIVKRLRKYYSTKYDYIFVPDRRIKFIPAPRTDGNVMIDYRVALTEDNLALLRPVEYLLVRDYAYAYVVESLGRIRGKYTSYPVVGGETSFGGVEELLEEAKTLYEALDKKIADLSEPLPILVR